VHGEIHDLLTRTFFGKCIKTHLQQRRIPKNFQGVPPDTHLKGGRERKGREWQEGRAKWRYVKGRRGEENKGGEGRGVEGREWKGWEGRGEKRREGLSRAAKIKRWQP
jgi:hypothetical protein